ncbi:MAG: hypothetical protein GY805_30750 [Chloroflexi bacterium]|nr:hypothetical protein [Chloroflexota bacterium]
MNHYRKLTSVFLLLSFLFINGWLLIKIASSQATSTLPLQKTVSAATDTTPICRFGVNGGAAYDIGSLRVGWYIDYGAAADPAKPNGAEYAPMIRLQQIGADNYSYSPSGTQLQNAILGNPNAEWLIGNEPDRRDVQDDIEPHVYAKAYHELYYLIRSEDPSARIFAGNIVQPTPLRLQYLDMVLASYQATYSTTMPVDGWSIHNFILNEGCDTWGAGIPPGIDTCDGVVVDVDDTDNLAIFQQRVMDFRTWMKDNGYKEIPLYVTEYGILMPQDFGYPSTRVNTFMSGTFDYMMTAEDAAIGYSADNNRLVQKWSWYSVSDKSFNGWQFEPSTQQLSDMGANYQSYTEGLQNEVDVLPTAITTTPPSLYSVSDPVTFTLHANIANIGYLPQETGSLGVRFYDGDPEMGGVQIGAEQFVSVGGGGTAVASVEWSNVSPGTHPVYIAVDLADGECSSLNNAAMYSVLVATDRVFLPIVQR